MLNGDLTFADDAVELPKYEAPVVGAFEYEISKSTSHMMRDDPQPFLFSDGISVSVQMPAENIQMAHLQQLTM